MFEEVMIKKIDIENLYKKEWYRQGGAIFLFYVFVPFQSIYETIGYDGCILYQKGIVNTAFFDRKRESELALKFIRACKNDKNKIVRWIKDWNLKILKLNIFLYKSFLKPVELWSDEELNIFLRHYNELNLNQWKKGVLCEWTDPSGYILMKEEISKYCNNLSEDDINLLTAPESLTFVQKELVDRLILMEKQKLGLDISRDLKKHSEKYFWFRDNWAFVYDLKAKDFQKIINKEMVDLENIKKQVEELKNYTRIIKKRKKDLIKKKIIPQEVQNIFYFFTKLTEWRDERKKFAACLPNHYLYKVLKIFAKKNNISEELVGMLLPFEINGWKLSKKVIKNLEKRSHGWIYCCNENKECQQFFGNQAEKIFSNLVKTLERGDLRGLVANRGFVRGGVKIVEVIEDFKKVKSGDIIVASMTRPEYIQIIKFAGGIITNEGGITCHAAIVSRELNIPCIIGTQVATEVLKDGDIIEMDANKGIIKKIN